jgi:hypothetical protein
MLGNCIWDRFCATANTVKAGVPVSVMVMLPMMPNPPPVFDCQWLTALPEIV